MAISMVRKPSETPNITNIDDIIPFRYAYGNQNGYVIGRGTELSHKVNGNQFTINSGRVVIQGVESDIDANGVTLTIDSVSETRYYVIYYEVNLATNTANIKLSNYSTTGYPTIDAGDDLTVNSTGIARLPLYRFTAKSGVISGVEKVVNAIKYTENIKIKNATQADNATNATKVQGVDLSSNTSAQFGEYTIQKTKHIGNGNFYFELPSGSNDASVYNISLITYPFLRFEVGKKYAINIYLTSSSSSPLFRANRTNMSNIAMCGEVSSTNNGNAFRITFNGTSSGFPYSTYPYCYCIQFEKYTTTGDTLNSITLRLITFDNEKSSLKYYVHIGEIYEIIE